MIGNRSHDTKHWWQRLAVLGIAVASVSTARGHFPFIVPESQQKVIVVFSDDLSPDPNVNIEKIANTRLTLRDNDGRETSLSWSKAEHCYQLKLPAGNWRVIYGVTDYGVLQKGDAPPFKLVYYPKAVYGDATAAQAKLGDAHPLEIVVEGRVGQWRFRVLHHGQPLPEAELTVLLPNGSKKTLKTDKAGFSPVFEATGRYGVWARWTEAKKGDYAGRTFQEIRHYATLVCDLKTP
jgi:uncharacterized GH25 family protein